MARESSTQEIGRRIASIRKQRGLSQAVVARRAGLDPSYFSRLETGRIHPTVRTAMRIAQSLRVAIEDLLGPTPPKVKGRPCPVSQSGQCLMDLIDIGEVEPTGKPERYSTRQLRLLRRFAGLVGRNDPDTLKAFEILLTQLREPSDGQPSGRGRRASRA